MKDMRLLQDARFARDVAHLLLSGDYIGKALAELDKSLDKVIAYLESDEE